MEFYYPKVNLVLIHIMNLKFQINIKLNAIDLNKVFGIPLNKSDNILIYIRNEMIKITFDNYIKNRTSGYYLD